MEIPHVPVIEIISFNDPSNMNRAHILSHTLYTDTVGLVVECWTVDPRVMGSTPCCCYIESFLKLFVKINHFFFFQPSEK